MAITIGNKLESDYTNPLGMLSDCHRRIERFLAVMVTITQQAEGAELNEDQRRAFETALRYFREGAPRHTRDEEDSLFPRLRQSSDARVQEAMALLDHLQQEHVEADALHQEAERLGHRWMTEGRLMPTEAQALAEMLNQLSAIYQKHIALEDAEVFPLAGSVLSNDEICALAREMAARRCVRLDAQMRPQK